MKPDKVSQLAGRDEDILVLPEEAQVAEAAPPTEHEDGECQCGGGCACGGHHHESEAEAAG